MINERKFITKLNKKFDDSVLTRVMARIDEFAYLIQKTKELIRQIDISEESFIKPKLTFNSVDEAIGVSSVEATRGSLYHEVKIKYGKIDSYNVITPTVWNLGPGDKDNYSVAQKAIIGNDSIAKAKIVLRSFDICSVCTTH